MQQQKNTYQSYLNLHNEFNEKHKAISKQITDLYQLPKNFMEENEKEIQRCMSKQAQNGVPHHVELSYNGIRDFLFIVEDFKLQTMELFFEHRVHIDKCTVYVMKVAELQTKHKDEAIGKFADEYVDLIPQLNELLLGLETLLAKAEAMVTRLETIETRWERINSKAH